MNNLKYENLPIEAKEEVRKFMLNEYGIKYRSSEYVRMVALEGTTYDKEGNVYINGFPY